MPIDMSAATTVKPPPRRSSRGTAATSRTVAVVTASPREIREEGLNGLAQLGQGLLLVGKQYAQAATVGMHMPGINGEVARLADSNDTIAKGVDFLIKVGPYGALLNLVIPFVMQTAANYGFIDAKRATGSGIVPPEVLTAQMQADVMKMQTEAIRAQQAAMLEAETAQREYEQWIAAQEQPSPNGTNGSEIKVS